MAERLMSTFPRTRMRRDKSGRRFRVRYDLAYDGGGSAWDGFYRTLIGARIAILWNRGVASWGGSADLYDRGPEPDVSEGR